MSRAAVCEAPLAEGEYKGFRLFQFQQRHYGVPVQIVRIPRIEVERAFRHPAVVVAPTIDAVRQLIDDFDPAPFACELVEELGEYNIFRSGETFYGVPREVEHFDPNGAGDRAREGVVSGESRDEVVARIRDVRAAVPVNFIGGLPVFARFGNCGTHPQFAHTDNPPAGYRFSNFVYDEEATRRVRRGGVFARVWRAVHGVFLSLAMFIATCRESGIRRSFATLFVFLRLFVSLARRTGHVRPTLRFLHSRHFQSQALAPRNTELVFVTSVPYTYGQSPWVIEIEDATSLFFPYVQNGRTCTGDVTTSPYYALVKAMLESDSCRGIVTHIKSTAEGLPVLFKSEEIARKVTYAPLGVRVPKRFQTHDAGDDTVDLLFTNSWHQNPDGFFLRGGLDVLEAFAVIRERYPNVRLTLRSAIPHMDERYLRIIQRGWVRVIDKFTSSRRMDELQRESHIYLLPAARIHIVSVLQAMAYGQAVVVSDGWGMEEYVEDGATGLVVPGRAGKVSWMDREAGMLREDYRPMYAPDPAVVEGLVSAVSRLVEDRALRRRLGRAARKEVETNYTVPQWNAALKSAFDKARRSA